MPYVAPSTVTTLQTYTSAAHNVIVNDIIDHETRIAALSPTGSQPSVGLSFVTGTSYTNGNAVPFASENWDTSGFHDNATNNTRITIPSGLAGTYMFEACAMANYSSQVTYAELNIRCNGTMETAKSIRGGVHQWPTGVSANCHFKAGGIAYNLIAGDYFELIFTATGGAFSGLSGGATTVTPTYFRAAWIAP
jgi:hypothetical protein